MTGMLVTPPRTPLWVTIISFLVALIVGAGIVYLVFMFGYYASGLAVVKEEERRRESTPIPAQFADPNDPPKARDPNSG